MALAKFVDLQWSFVKGVSLDSAVNQGVMQDISGILKDVYAAHSVVLVPGSGTFGMEAVARQFAHGQKVMVIRNGWFSFRWTEIFDMGKENSIPSSHTVLKALPQPTEGSNLAARLSL